MPTFSYTPYFERRVLVRRAYLRREFCEFAILHPLRVEIQPDGRVRYWAAIAERGGRVLRVVTLRDRHTIHNAFLDRGYKP